MDTVLYLLLYITTLVATTWFSFIAASTDIGTPNVPTTHSPDHLTSGKDIHYDVTTMAPKDFLQSEILSVRVQTTDLPSDTVSEEDEELLLHTVILTHASATASAEQHRTPQYKEGALAGITTSSLGRSFESTSAVSLTELRNRHDGDEFHTMSSSATEQVTMVDYTEKRYETTSSSEHPTSFRKSTSTGRRRPGMFSTSSKDSKTSSEELKARGFEDGSGHQNEEIPEEPIHRHRNEGLVTEANINHAALWITVAFVAVLLVYITVLIIYNAKKRDWHQSLPPYTRFVEETTPEEQEPPGTLDRMLQRITGKRNTEDGYSLSF